MIVMFRTLVVLVILWLVRLAEPLADVVVNEVLANEPGSSRTLEWIELYNDSAGVTSLASFYLVAGGDTVTFDQGLMMAPREHLVICRRLYTLGTSPGFESYWGNDSRAWGDDPLEAAYGAPIEASFSLVNPQGRVGLYDSQDQLVSILAWFESGRDGYSWERVSPASTVIEQSRDQRGATPGAVNSLMPVENDLSLTLVSIRSIDAWTEVSLEVRNLGMTPVPSVVLTIEVSPEDDPGTLIDTYEYVSPNSLAPSEAISIIERFTFPGVYVAMELSLPDDDRPFDNRIDVIAPAEEFPPVLLSEVLANPWSGLESEWVEIVGVGSETLDVGDWLIGDSLAAHTIAREPLLIQPGEYVVLAQDSAVFRSHYSDFDGKLAEPRDWAALNNDGDVVRLIDRHGYEADRFRFGTVFPYNQSWSRSDEPDGDGEWGRSAGEGGSPGEPNDVLFEPSGSEISLSITPAVFSPDGDGRDDCTMIHFEVPFADGYKMKVYDRRGRAVCTFDVDPYFQDSLPWCGQSDDGRRLPIGIYIVYLEVGGRGSVKKPVVIAR